jgi:hypothetical protein
MTELPRLDSNFVQFPVAGPTGLGLIVVALIRHAHALEARVAALEALVAASSTEEDE